MSTFAVSPASAHELMPALRVLFASRSNPERESRAEHFRDALTTDERDSTALFVTRDAAGRVNGAALVQSLPGALGVVSPPRAESPEAEDALTAAARDWLRSRGVKVCQVFAAADEIAEVAPLERGGFRHVTQLVFLRRELSPSIGEPPTRSLAIVAEARPFSAEFRATLLATYEATRDCPELNGERTADELLIGLTDPTPATDYYLATNRESAVGALMLSKGSEPGIVELAYLGVVASARGRGLGDELLRFALSEALLARATALTLSVDARNEPALRLYRRHGFVETERREVWLAHFTGERRGVSPT